MFKKFGKVFWVLKGVFMIGVEVTEVFMVQVTSIARFVSV